MASIPYLASSYSYCNNWSIVFNCCIVESQTLPTLSAMNKTSTLPNNQLSTAGQRDKEKAIVANEGVISGVGVKNEWKRIHSLLQDVVSSLMHIYVVRQSISFLTLATVYR